MNNFIGPLQIGLTSSMAATAKAIARSIERISSGKITGVNKGEVALTNWESRISAQARGLRQATLGINQAIGEAATASAALSQQVDILSRMKEIAMSAGSTTLTYAQRSDLNSEMQSLYDQFDLIARETKFSGRSLLDGSFATQRIQMSSNKGDTTQLLMDGSTKDVAFRTSYYTGDGTFSNASTVSSIQGWYFKAGDINGDGNSDIAMVVNSTLTIETGNGDGTFAVSATATVSGSSGTLRIADLNGDGNQDITVGSSNGTLNVFLGNGDGTVHSAMTSTFSTVTSSLRDHLFFDFNSDGYLDIVGTSASGSSYIDFALGNGDGTFRSTTTISTGTSSNNAHLYAEDINNDGKRDLIISGSTSLFAATVLLSNNDGSFQAAISTQFNPATATSGIGVAIAPADYNGDGIMDFAAYNMNGGVGAYLGNGDGTFSRAATVAASATQPSYAEAADFNSDGRMDFAMSITGNTSIFLGNGNGTFSISDTTASMSFDGAIADFNNDNMLDILYSLNSQAIYYGQGTASIQAAELSVMTTADADKALTSIEASLSNVLENRAQIDALYSRMDTAVAANLLWADNLDTARENATNTDMALEVADLVRNQIISDSQTAVFAQANMSMRLVMDLLKGLTTS